MNRREAVFGTIAVGLTPTTALAKVCEKTSKSHYEGSLNFSREYPSYFRLNSPYAFVDGCGKRWQAPSGTVTDGASIPPFAQIFVGDPYSGGYLDAAIIHDWFCVARIETHDDVHRMFFNAMVASRVGPTLARVMYTAVCWKGPKWDYPTMMNSRLLYNRDPRLLMKTAIIPPAVAGGISMPPPVRLPDGELLEQSKAAMLSGDTSNAAALLAKYEAQVASFEKSRDEEISRKIAESAEAYQRDRERKDTENKVQQEAAKFRELLNQTDGLNLDEVANVAKAFPAAVGTSSANY